LPSYIIFVDDLPAPEMFISCTESSITMMDLPPELGDIDETENFSKTIIYYLKIPKNCKRYNLAK
jgi:hypothetical protein